jgi:hypothetical protein
MVGPVWGKAAGTCGCAVVAALPRSNDKKRHATACLTTV